jgi:hypothetical protein
MGSVALPWDNAFRRMGASEEDARSAATALTRTNTELTDFRHEVERRFDMQKMDSRFSLLSWIVGANTAIMLIVLGKLLLMHS